MSGIMELVGVRRLPREVGVSDLKSAEGVPGYSTVGDWWASRMWQALDLLSDPVAVLSSDAEALQSVCERRGIDYKLVAPTPLAASLGFASSRAFPEWLLAEFYPVNP